MDVIALTFLRWIYDLTRIESTFAGLSSKTLGLLEAHLFVKPVVTMSATNARRFWQIPRIGTDIKMVC